MTDVQHAELEVLRDLKERLIFFDGGPEVMSWEAAHRHHADEPYIGCVFCRAEFVRKAELDRYRDAIEEYLLWEPGRRGHAEAHRRLRSALDQERRDD